MVEERVQRRLAAILAADVVGYSRLMGADEAGTLARLKTLRAEVFDPKTAEYGGRIVKTTGDGVLVEFPSAVDAVQHAIDVQQETARRNADEAEDRRIALRIGINLGDVIVDGEDIHGDGVNVAARLEALAEPGGVYLSDLVHASIRGKLDISMEDLGDQSLKNIAEPVRVWRVVPEAVSPEGGAATDALFRRPAVAVLPFENLSGDPEQEYFADGLTEDIITALSLWRSFPVIARNSTFAYKGTSPDIRKVGQELGARYVVEGSVRRAGNRIRVTAQLINAENGHHVWAERYDRDLDDIFVVQDELSIAIVAAIEPAMARFEQERAKRKASESFDAWDAYHQGMALFAKRNESDIAGARAMFLRAIEIDPNFAMAHAGYALTYYWNVMLAIDEPDREAAEAAARRAVDLDPDEAEAHFALASVHWANHEIERAIPECETATRLNPSYAPAFHLLGTLLVHVGKPREALPHLFSAIELSPKDPSIALFHARVSLAYLYLRDHENAVEWGRKAVSLPNIQWPGHCFLVASLAHLDRTEEAGKALADLLAFRPGITVRFIRERYPVIVRENFEHLLAGLRKAGLPE